MAAFWAVGTATLCLGQEDKKSSLTYEIKTTWDGEPIDHDPARVTLSVTEGGDVNLTMSALFFNSPHPEEPVIENCQERSTFGLWKYEVCVCILQD